MNLEYYYRSCDRRQVVDSVESFYFPKKYFDFPPAVNPNEMIFLTIQHKNKHIFSFDLKYFENKFFIDMITIIIKLIYHLLLFV